MSSETDWSAEYARRLQTFDALRVAIHDRLAACLDREAIALSQIESRTKTVRSFAEKITSKGKYADPLEEITDLAGLRVIVYYPDDVRAVGAVIDRELTVDWTNSNRSGHDDPPDRFGYRSDHYIVSLPESERFAGLRAEIQVRTVMQHAWAAVDHEIRYKAADLPRDLSRRLFRLSALLELADEQFAGLQLASRERSAEYARALEHGDLAVAVDILSLRVLAERADVGQWWAQRAVALGYDPVDPDAGARDDLMRLLHIVRRLGATVVADVAALLPRDPDAGDAVLRDVIAGLRARPGQATFWAFPGDVLALIILGLQGTEPLIRASGFRPEIQDVLIRRL
ncbi:ppGpp synthetase/RelA/SpoT-type nucleotidyltransferase [Solirubrobacter pauli]|uniref:PpGpp synthetase/RelA/SpoT-type nucleotidyltransferase n=1 Tax=Solirubrobacter pauli TaxID=166793 RepID=A0A660L5V7_9ACTN|nr:hypothetical protein [Solirubrobacter pauli]RKQ90432.1 ppGpp synthetase/RelA/SpoT-type nucleotidyltransferase [Solirubrobacter pauli]